MLYETFGHSNRPFPMPKVIVLLTLMHQKFPVWMVSLAHTMAQPMNSSFFFSGTKSVENANGPNSVSWLGQTWCGYHSWSLSQWTTTGASCCPAYWSRWSAAGTPSRRSTSWSVSYRWAGLHLIFNLLSLVVHKPLTRLSGCCQTWQQPGPIFYVPSEARSDALPLTGHPFMDRPHPKLLNHADHFLINATGYIHT